MKITISLILIILGLVSGSSALDVAQFAKPPIDWNAIPFVIIGTVLAIILVVAFQMLGKNDKFA